MSYLLLLLFLSFLFPLLHFDFHGGHLLSVSLLLFSLLRLADLLSDILVDHATTVHFSIASRRQLLICIHTLELLRQVLFRGGVRIKLGVELVELFQSLLLLHLAK